jgi:Sulfate permease family
MSATAALSAATVSSVATAGSGRFAELTAALAISAGLAALIAGLLRLGFLASFISEPVLKGFIVGLALTIIVGQLPALFGVAKGSGDFFQKLWDLITNLGDTQASQRGWGPPRPTRPSTTTTSTSTTSWSGSGRPTSRRAFRAGWWSTAACPKRP